MLAVLAGPLATAGAAQSGVTACESVVGDLADRLTPDEEQAVREAAAALSSDTIGTVRVRLLDTVGGDLDAWATDELGRCPAWNTPAGGGRATFLLLAVALDDRLTGTYYGAELVDTLDPVRQRVHDGVMAPRLREGDVAAALTAGLAAYRDVLVGAPGPAEPTEPTEPTAPTSGADGDDDTPAGGDTDLGAGSAPDDGVVQVVSEQVGTASPAALLLGVLGLAGAGAGALAVGRRRRRREAVDAVRATATDVTGRLDALHRTWIVGASDRRAALALVGAGDRTATALVREQDEADAALAIARDAVLRAPDPDTLRRVDDCAAADTAWTAAGREVDVAVTEVEQAVAAATALIAVVEAAPRRIDEAAGAVEAARGSLEAVAADGFRVDGPAARLDRADDTLGRARTCLADGRPGDAADLAGAALEQATAAGAEATALPAQRADLLARATALRARTATLESDRAAAVHALARLREGWARTAWEELADVPDGATAALRDLRSVPFRVEAEAAMSTQRFAAAATALDDAEARADALATALASVPARLEAVEEADAALYQVHGRTVAAADVVRDLLQRRSGSLGATSVAAAQVQLDELDGLLPQVEATPRDPLRLTTLLHRAERTLAAAAQDARAEADRTDAARRRAREAIADAERAVERARGWFRILPEPRLGRADDLLDRARGLVTSDPDAASGLAAQAELLAEQVRGERHRGGGGGFGTGVGLGFGAGHHLGSSSGSSSGFGGGGSSSGGGGGWSGGGSSGW